MKKRACLTCSILSMVGLPVVVVGAIIIGAIFYAEYATSARVVEQPSLTADLPTAFQLTSEQQSWVGAWGYPDAFSLLFYEEVDEAGAARTIRYEVWDYYTQNQQLIYLDGEMQAAQTLDVGDVTPIPTAYRPEQFQAYMSLEQVVAAAQLGSYLAIPLEDELVAEGEIFYAGGLAFGLKDDQLLYIETFIGEAGE